MNWTERRKRFRALLAGKRCVHTGSVFDPIIEPGSVPPIIQPGAAVPPIIHS